MLTGGPLAVSGLHPQPFASAGGGTIATIERMGRSQQVQGMHLTMHKVSASIISLVMVLLVSSPSLLDFAYVLLYSYPLSSVPWSRREQLCERSSRKTMTGTRVGTTVEESGVSESVALLGCRRELCTI